MVEDYISFQIDGYCQPKQRTFGNYITPKETRVYENLVKTLAKLAMQGKPPLRGPVGVLIAIECAVPKSFTAKKNKLISEGKLYPTHADIENCSKSLCDAMNLVCYEDDRQIQKLAIERKYGPVEHVFVTIYMIEPEETPS